MLKQSVQTQVQIIQTAKKCHQILTMTGFLAKIQVQFFEILIDFRFGKGYLTWIILSSADMFVLNCDYTASENII